MTDFDFKFKKLLLKCLINGKVDEKSKNNFIELLRSQTKDNILVRDATESERKQLKIDMQTSNENEPNEQATKTDGENLFNRDLFKRALKAKFESVKNDFLTLFDIVIVVIVY